MGGGNVPKKCHVLIKQPLNTRKQEPTLRMCLRVQSECLWKSLLLLYCVIVIRLFSNKHSRKFIPNLTPLLGCANHHSIMATTVFLSLVNRCDNQINMTNSYHTFPKLRFIFQEVRVYSKINRQKVFVHPNPNHS